MLQGAEVLKNLRRRKEGYAVCISRIKDDGSLAFYIEGCFVRRLNAEKYANAVVFDDDKSVPDEVKIVYVKNGEVYSLD